MKWSNQKTFREREVTENKTRLWDEYTTMISQKLRSRVLDERDETDQIDQTDEIDQIDETDEIT